MDAVMEHVGSKATYLEGETIFPSGTAGRHLYVVLSGRVELHTEDGRVEYVGPGEILGEHAARMSRAQAVVDSELMAIAS
jgi:CRP-like cAMP-binding protein